jgi:hypothetical protein
VTDDLGDGSVLGGYFGILTSPDSIQRTIRGPFRTVELVIKDILSYGEGLLADADDYSIVYAKFSVEQHVVGYHPAVGPE